MVGHRLVQDFIIPALQTGIYGDLLKWDSQPGVFAIKWTHKAKASWTTEESEVFKAWDRKKCRKEPQTDQELVNSKQRLRAALRNIKSIEEVECLAPGYRKYLIIGPAEEGESIKGKLKPQTKPMGSGSHHPDPAEAVCPRPRPRRKTKCESVMYGDDQDDQDPEYNPSASRTRKPRKRGRGRRRYTKKTKAKRDCEKYDVRPEEPLVNQVRNSLEAPNLLESDNQVQNAHPPGPCDTLNQINFLEAPKLFTSDSKEYRIKQELMLDAYEQITYDTVMPNIFIDLEPDHLEDVSIIDLDAPITRESRGVCSIPTIKVKSEPQPGPSKENCLDIPHASTITETASSMDVWQPTSIAPPKLPPKKIPKRELALLQSQPDVFIIDLDAPITGESREICSMPTIKVERKPHPGPSTENVLNIPVTSTIMETASSMDVGQPTSIAPPKLKPKKIPRKQRELALLQSQAEIFCRGTPKRTTLVSQECWATSIKTEVKVDWIEGPRLSRRNMNKKLDYNEFKTEPADPEVEQACAIEEKNVEQTIYSFDVPNEPTSTSTLLSDMTSSLYISNKNPKAKVSSKSTKVDTSQGTPYSFDVPNEPTSSTSTLLGVTSNLSVSAKKPQSTKAKTQARKKVSSSRGRQPIAKKTISSSVYTVPTSIFGSVAPIAINPITPAVYTFPTDRRESLADALVSPQAFATSPLIYPPCNDHRDVSTTIAPECIVLDDDKYMGLINNPMFSSAMEWRQNNMLEESDFILGMKRYCRSLDPNCQCWECRAIKKNIKSPYAFSLYKAEPDF